MLSITWSLNPDWMSLSNSYALAQLEAIVLVQELLGRIL